LACVVTQTLIACSSGTTSSGQTPASADPDSGTSADPGTDASEPPPASGGATAITGTLGKLGAAKATVASLYIENSGETLIYMSSAPITCELLKNSRWLGSAEANSQVVEVVISGKAKVGKIAVPPGEVNYAGGGKSSAYEVNAESGAISFTAVTDKSVVEGTFSASYADGSKIQGNFHATFCDGGQGY
jgi:hypothetical protein